MGDTIDGLVLINGVAVSVGATDDGVESLGDSDFSYKGDGINGIGVGGNIILILTGVGGVRVFVAGNDDGIKSMAVASIKY